MAWKPGKYTMDTFEMSTAQFKCVPGAGTSEDVVAITSRYTTLHAPPNKEWEPH
jgi:hypothetical protein